jgi:hypothetical protein
MYGLTLLQGAMHQNVWEPTPYKRHVLLNTEQSQQMPSPLARSLNKIRVFFTTRDLELMSLFTRLSLLERQPTEDLKRKLGLCTPTEITSTDILKRSVQNTLLHVHCAIEVGGGHTSSQKTGRSVDLPISYISTTGLRVNSTLFYFCNTTA